MAALRASRKVVLIWTCRDADMVEYVMEKTTFDDDAWSFIFYTGKRKLVLGDKPSNPYVKVVLGRPDLPALIPSIMRNSVYGDPLPHAITARVLKSEKALYERTPAAYFCDAFVRAMTTYSIAEMYEIAKHESSVRTDGFPAEVVSANGFVAIMRLALRLGEAEVTDKQLRSYFEAVDENGDDSLEYGEFKVILDKLQSVAEKELLKKEILVLEDVETGTPVEDVCLGPRESSLTAQQRTLQAWDRFTNWHIFYCGGSAAVKKQLDEVRRKCGIPTVVDSFQW